MGTCLVLLYWELERQKGEEARSSPKGGIKTVFSGSVFDTDSMERALQWPENDSIR